MTLTIIILGATVAVLSLRLRGQRKRIRTLAGFYRDERINRFNALHRANQLQQMVDAEFVAFERAINEAKS